MFTILVGALRSLSGTVNKTLVGVERRRKDPYQGSGETNELKQSDDLNVLPAL